MPLCIHIWAKCSSASIAFHPGEHNIVGRTFPGEQVRPRKLSNVLTSLAQWADQSSTYVTYRYGNVYVYHPDDAHVRTLFPLVAIVGWKYTTHGKGALQVWHTLTVRLAHFASGVGLPTSPPPHPPCYPPVRLSMDHIFCLASSPPPKPGLILCHVLVTVLGRWLVSWQCGNDDGVSCRDSHVQSDVNISLFTWPTIEIYTCLSATQWVALPL